MPATPAPSGAFELVPKSTGTIDLTEPAAATADEALPTAGPVHTPGAGDGAGTEAARLVPLRQASVAEVAQRAFEGDARAWEELVSRFGGMIAATGRRYRLSPSDVAELQQTTWLKLVENFGRIEQPERIGGWLATTARRESLQILRRAARYTSGAEQVLDNLADRRLPEPDARPIAAERDAVLHASWAQLKPRCQELLSLLLADDAMGYKDLSKLLDMPVGSIGPTRMRCLEQLRKLVEQQGVPI